jgi:hypothetical protein
MEKVFSEDEGIKDFDSGVDGEETDQEDDEAKVKPIEERSPGFGIPTIYNHHQTLYDLAKERLNKHRENIDYIDEVKTYLVNNPINCIKYNYCIEQSLSDFSCCQAQIQLSENCKYLQIIIKKPKNNNEFILEADPKLVDKAREEKSKAKDDPKFYNFKKSSSSTYVSNIIGFIYGGSSSRFWMLRKHFNLLPPKELAELPFYSW